jgi:S1-C subfamily serine protease
VRGATVVLLAAVAACGSAGGREPADAAVVDVTAQPCATPNRSHGLGVVVGDDLVVTAAHTVDEPQRVVTADGEPATVRLLDRRTDLALLDVDLDVAPVELSDAPPDATATVVTPDGEREVTIVRTGRLLVHDVTDRADYEREVHTFTPGVRHGTSGGPLLDGDGRLLGIVVLDEPGDGVAHAVTAAELAALIESAPSSSPAVAECPSG